MVNQKSLDNLHMKPRLVVCKICGRDFMSSHTQAMYCPEPCRHLARLAEWRDYKLKNKHIGQQWYDRNRDKILQKARYYRSTMAGKKTDLESHKRYRLKYPEKRRAHQIVMLSILLGYLKREPCKQCGAEKSQAHHPDYSQPLLVEWFCDSCHKKEHQRLKKGENNGTEIKADTNIKHNTGN